MGRANILTDQGLDNSPRLFNPFMKAVRTVFYQGFVLVRTPFVLCFTRVRPWSYSVRIVFYRGWYSFGVRLYCVLQGFVLVRTPFGLLFSRPLYRESDRSDRGDPFR